MPRTKIVSKKLRLNIDIVEVEHKELKDESLLINKTMGDIVRSALSIRKFVMDAKKNNAKLLVKYPDGTINEVILLE